MKQLILILFVLFIGLTVKSQILKPVSWAYAFKRNSPNEATIYLKATIEEKWHIYSQDVKSGGPIKTSFTFAKSPSYILIGATSEPKPISKFEKNFDMDVNYFERSVTFSQKVKLKNKAAVVKGTLEFMTCDDHQCLPPEQVAFSVAIK